MNKQAKALAAITLMIAVAFFAGCKPEEDTNNNGNDNNGNQPADTITVPRVVTSAVFDITETRAFGGGEVTSDGGSDIIERGVCWSTAIHPSVSGDHAYDSLGLGTFSFAMTDLLPETTYYVRAYAINGKGISYGEQVSFSTLSLPEPPEPNTEAAFVGIWGVEQIDYYSIDFWGNPISGTMETYYFTPGDPDNGIDLVFWEDHRGEMRDRSRDTLFQNYDDFLGVYLDTIICPDTTLITGFSYAYHPKDSLLIMNMETQHPITYRMLISSFTDDSFVFINNYDSYYVEKAYMKRLSFVPEKPRSTNTIVSDWPTKGPLLRR